MDTDNPDGPESAIAARLADALEPEAIEPEAAIEAEPEQTEAEEPEDGEGQPAEEDTIDVEDDDGVIHKVSAKLKDGILRRADYTRKTQQTANLAETAHDRLQYAEAREQMTGQLVQEIAEIRAMHAQLKQYDGVDLASMYSQDPGTAMRIRDQREDLRRQIQEREQQVGQKGRQLEAIAEQHFAKQWEMAVEGVKTRIGSYTPGEDAAMLKQVQALGLTAKEIRGRFADPRILHAIYKAAKWDTLQAGKGQAVQKAQAAPPVVKPGAVQGNVAAAKEKALRAQFKKSGDYRDAAKLLLLKG